MQYCNWCSGLLQRAMQFWQSQWLLLLQFSYFCFHEQLEMVAGLLVVFWAACNCIWLRRDRYKGPWGMLYIYMNAYLYIYIKVLYKLGFFVVILFIIPSIRYVTHLLFSWGILHTKFKMFGLQNLIYITRNFKKSKLQNMV